MVLLHCTKRGLFWQEFRIIPSADPSGEQLPTLPETEILSAFNEFRSEAWLMTYVLPSSLSGAESPQVLLSQDSSAVSHIFSVALLPNWQSPRPQKSSQTERHMQGTIFTGDGISLTGNPL